MLIACKPDHVKTRIEDNQEETVKKYRDIMRAIQNPASTIPHLTPDMELMPTYLCFHCTHIATYDERDSHDKEHALCKTWGEGLLPRYRTDDLVRRRVTPGSHLV